jgi:hypothetical protein
VVVTYEDLGNDIRLSTNLHSYDVERPAFAKFIHEAKGRKTSVNDAIDHTVMALLRTLCQMGFVSSEIECDSLFSVLDSDVCFRLTDHSLKILKKKGVPDEVLKKLDKLKGKKFATRRTFIRILKNTIGENLTQRYKYLLLKYSEKNELQKRIAEVKMPEIRKTKSIGFRLGANSHNDPAIFAGKESAMYWEVYFSSLIPNLHFFGLDFGIETPVGFDLPDYQFPFKGVISINGFINGKAVYSGWQYSNLPFIFSAGAGVGCQGIRYKFEKGVEHYESKDNSDKEFTNGVIRLAFDWFIEMEFPLSEKFRFHALLRKISETSEITTFENAPVDYKKPVGKMGGHFFVCGLKFLWR